MTELLILLTLPEPVRRRYAEGIRAAFPEITVNVVDHNSKVDPYIGTADILVTFGPMMKDAVFGAAPRLKWVQALGTGTDGIADQPSLGKEVIITNMHGFHGPPVAEAALTGMLALARGTPRAIRSQLDRKWDRFPARTLNESTVVIYGVGDIACYLAPLCKAFGMRVIGVSSAPREVPGFDLVVGRDQLTRVVGEADHLVLLTPYTPATRHSVNAEVFAAMKCGAMLVNVARGGVVDEQALVAALESGQVGGAALDVFSSEPLPTDHPFWAMPNVIITPHQGGFFDRYPDHALPVLCENLKHFLAGHTDQMINIVRKA
jgi:phosphoglycerate dehydrogenase-like enzyme